MICNVVTTIFSLKKKKLSFCVCTFDGSTIFSFIVTLVI